MEPRDVVELVNTIQPFEQKLKENKCRICYICNKLFKTSSSYSKHLKLCEFKYEMKYENKKLSKQTEELSYKQLVSLVINMNKELQDLKTLVKKSHRKKISILEWLNKNVSCSISFQEWYYNLDTMITIEDLNTIFKYGYIQGIGLLIKQWIPIDNEEENIPFRAFNEKKNTIYVYIESQDKSQGCYWTQMTTQQKSVLNIKIQSIFMNLLLKWKQHREKHILHMDIEKNDEEYKQYLNYRKKVLGDDKENSVILTNTMRHLYNHVKMRLMGTVEYEFKFV